MVAAAAAQVEARWLSTDALDLLDPERLAAAYRWFWVPQEDPQPSAKGGKAPKGAKPKQVPEAPSLLGGVLARQAPALASPAASALPAYLVGLAMQDSVVGQRDAVAPLVTPAVTVSAARDLALHRRLLTLLEGHKGKFPPGFDLRAFKASGDGEEDGDGPMPDGLANSASVKAAVVGT